jgi:putative ABC transport system permease protein
MALASVLRDSSRGMAGARARLQKGLVVAQIAFTQPLVVAIAAFLVLVLSTLQPAAMTDTPDRVVTVHVEPTSSTASTDAERAALMDRVIARLQATPGIEKVVPSWGSGGWPANYVAAGDNGASKGTVELAPHPIDSEYFGVLGVPLKYGRQFTRTDVMIANTPRATVPVIIGADLAAKLWGNVDPVGRRFETTLDTATNMRTLEVVGVVDDPIARSRPTGDAFAIYAPGDTGSIPREVMLRTTAAASTLLPTIRNVVSAEAPGAVAEVNTLAGIEAATRRNLRMVYGGISAAAGIALTLAAIGLYAVVAFSVAQRTHEIAVRLSVGARGAQIARAFVGDGLKLSAIGMAIGLPLSLFGLKFVLNPMMVVPIPISPVATIAAIAVIIVAAAAAWIPARRAAAVDPANVLRGG